MLAYRRGFQFQATSHGPEPSARLRAQLAQLRRAEADGAGSEAVTDELTAKGRARRAATDAIHRANPVPNGRQEREKCVDERWLGQGPRHCA